jgi:SOS-response transcriptional repressor LexA
MLTKQQRKLLVFIERYINENGGIAPMFSEMVAGTGIKSKGQVHVLLLALEERGYIRRLYSRRQAIEVLKPAPPLYFRFNDETKRLECVSPITRSSDTESASALARPGRT